MNTETNLPALTPTNILERAEMAQAAADAANVKPLPAIDATIIRDAEGMAEGLLLTFGDATTLTVMCAELTDAMQYEAQVHGLKQKLVDAAALPRDTKTGRSATVADKKAAVLEVHTRLMEGRWNKGRAEGGNREGGLLARAMAEFLGQPVADAKVWLAARTKQECAALRMNPKIKVIIDRLRDEADKPVSAGIDTEALLAAAMAARMGA